eukprot:TRINITY_DN11179_c0_g1_i1.p3 TRINITY_DN11179_c0_g1~~TRINITY_DN11179_c0_g1_i1.p3  ORF type:complete len:121 (-),score=28.17 TRINITY_DN11179_c0_g1_i1:87-449(-)
MEPPPGAAHLNLTAGALLIAGGGMGYFKAGSVPSLVAGVGTGGLFLGSGMLVAQDPQAAFLLGTGTGGLLTAGMLPRFLKTKKVMPTGMVSFLGVATLAFNGHHLSQWWDPETLPFRKQK